MFLFTVFPKQLREANNFTADKADGWKKLAAAVVFSYGHKYQRAADYLNKLANNGFWTEAVLPRLEWHEINRTAPALGEPRYVVHDAILNALAPAVPLRTVWQGDRRQ